MKKMFAALANNTKLQLKEQEERHVKEIAHTKLKEKRTHKIIQRNRKSH
jgi:hypothetical protein